MYALSIRQPWASLIVDGPKRVENRSRRLRYRGPVLIHASAKHPEEECLGAFALLAKRNMRTVAVELADWLSAGSMLTGGIIGVARIVDCLPSDRLWELPADQRHWFTGPFGWILGDVQPVPFLPLKGSLGLFRADPPSEWLLKLSPESAALCR